MAFQEPHHAGAFAPVQHSLYASKRERRDNGWTIGYCLLAAFTGIGGIIAFAKSAAQDLGSDFPSAFWANSTTCDAASFDTAWLQVQQASQSQPGSEDDDEEVMSFAKAFGKAIGAWIPITIAVGLVLSFVYVSLFRRKPEAMVKLSLAAAVVLSGLLAIIMLGVGAIPFGIILLFFSIMLAASFYFMREQLQMCAHLLSVAGTGLTDNGKLIPASLCLQTFGVGAVAYMFAGVVAAANLGRPVPSSNVMYQTFKTQLNGAPISDQVGACYDASGFSVNCCTHQTSGGAAMYMVLASVCLAWTVQLVYQVKLHIIADTIAQWYYMPAGAFTNGIDQPSVGVAARHALTTGFGSVTAAAAMLTLLRMVRSMMRRAARNNIICCIMNCILQPLLEMLEKFTKFASIATAINNKPFFQAAFELFDILKRNFLQTYSVWWVPDFVVHMSVLLFALTWAGVPFAVHTMVGNAGSPLGMAFAVAAVCFGIMLFILSFMGGVLLDIVNTIYVCFALDRDQKRVVRPEIHAIYTGLPTLKGAVVENPGGEVLYGQPVAAPSDQAPTQQGPPTYAAALDMQPLMGSSAAQGYSAVPAQGYSHAPAPYSTPYAPAPYNSSYQPAPQYGSGYATVPTAAAPGSQSHF